MPRINTRKAYEAIENLEPFTTNGALSGDFDLAGNFVIKSYSTAIAVLYPETRTAITNGAKYSVTTSKHQGTTNYGISRLGYAQMDITNPEAFTEATGYRARVRGTRTA